MPTSLTRIVRFHARHHYRVPGWSDEQNRERFGALVESHAHDYRCEVRVSGAPDPVTGMTADLGLLDRVLAEEVTRPLDGADLNQAVPAFALGTTQPTCEALAQHLFQRIAAHLPVGLRLERVRIAEDSTLHADCTGIA